MIRDIDALFAQHRLWMDTHGGKGTQFVFREAKIEDLFLHDQMLTQLVILESDLKNAGFADVNLDYANFGGTNFDAARFERVAMVKSDVYEASFCGALLKDVNAFRTDFVNCNFSDAHLNNVIFSNGSLRESNLQRARIVGCNFWKTSLIGVKGLEDASVEWIDIGPPQLPHRNGAPQILAGEQARRWLIAESIRQQEQMEALVKNAGTSAAKRPGRAAGTGARITLYLAVGLKELDLILQTGCRRFPPSLVQQPIFYPVFDRQYACEIAEKRKAEDPNSGYAGFVMQFEIPEEYAKKFTQQPVGALHHRELWVPSKELDAFNAHIFGHIRIINAFYGEKYDGSGVQEGFSQECTQQLRTLYAMKQYNPFDFSCSVQYWWRMFTANYIAWLRHDFRPALSPEEKWAILLEVKRVLVRNYKWFFGEEIMPE